jgi:hypothetical protein
MSKGFRRCLLRDFLCDLNPRETWDIRHEILSAWDQAETSLAAVTERAEAALAAVTRERDRALAWLAGALSECVCCRRDDEGDHTCPECGGITDFNGRVGRHFKHASDCALRDALSTHPDAGRWTPELGLAVVARKLDVAEREGHMRSIWFCPCDCTPGDVRGERDTRTAFTSRTAAEACCRACCEEDMDDCYLPEAERKPVEVPLYSDRDRRAARALAPLAAVTKERDRAVELLSIVTDPAPCDPITRAGRCDAARKWLAERDAVKEGA